jgi:CBS domain-containing protein
MAKLPHQQLADILAHLRECRADVLHDREAFQKAALGLEHAAQFAGAPIGVGLGRSRDKLLALLEKEAEQTQQQGRRLFETVLEARNMAVHDGAWVRHRSDQLVELILLLEEAVLNQLTLIDQIMVKSVTVAEPHHQLAHARRIMLSNSFSVLPVLTNQWHLLSDEAIIGITRAETHAERHSRLSVTVENAVRRYRLRLTTASAVSPDELVSNVLKNSPTWPLLVTDDGSTNGRLLGIVTPFDLL